MSIYTLEQALLDLFNDPTYTIQEVLLQHPPINNCKKENNAFFGKHHTDEFKQKMSNSKKGISTISEEGRNKISISNKGNTHALGYRHTEETKQKMSIDRKGRKHTEESKERLSLAKMGNKQCVGRILSEETKQKMREKALIREANKRMNRQ